MPRFNVDDIIIDPDDYVNECSSKEIEELLDEIRARDTEVYDDFIKGDIEEALQNDMNETRSNGQRIFNQHLKALREGWYSISKEDSDIITILAKKYGAV